MIADVDFSRARTGGTRLGKLGALLTTATLAGSAAQASPTLAERLAPAVPAAATAAGAGDFWASWGDGKAELSGYRLKMPRYGQLRDGSLVLIYVTEDLSDSLRVKADPGRHPPTDVYPVLKLNAMRKFQTGIYDYSVMTSVFARVDFAPTERPFPLRKISMSSQEWCGQVYHQVVPQDAGWSSTSHSYFDGEADEQRVLVVPPAPAVAVSEDELPLLLRTWAQRREFLGPGQQRTVAFLPSLVRARLLHQPLAFSQAVVSRLAAPLPIKTPAGEFTVVSYTVTLREGDRATFHFAATPPYHLIHYRWESGEEATLLGSTRLPYWKLHDNGQEALLKQLGFASPVKN